MSDTSKFRASLRSLSSATNDLSANNRPAPQTADEAGCGPELRILMAEDNAINQRVAKLILQRAGYVIDVAKNGKEAVDSHLSHPYDVILMDCQMPVMDGFEASRSIREASQPQPVIIAVTANALVGEREKCLEAGMDDYLSKPFRADQLVAIIQKWSALKGSNS